MLDNPVLRLSFLSLSPSEMWDAHRHVFVETERNAELKDTLSLLFHLNFALGKCPQIEEMKMSLDRSRRCGRRFDKAEALLPADMVTQTDL